MCLLPHSRHRIQGLQIAVDASVFAATEGNGVDVGTVDVFAG